MNNIKKSIIAISTFALVCGASISGALAYFTASAEAEGGVTLKLAPKTKIKETISGTDKIITVENIGDGDEETEDADVYVRVIVLNGEDQTVTITGSGWTDGGDGYWYYNSALKPGESTSSLTAAVEVKGEITHDFDVIVAQECCAVNFEGANGPSYAGWALTAKEAE